MNIKAAVEMSKKGDWERAMAIETLKVRLAETTDRREAQLIRLALVNIG
jgi:hypothetical protein